MTITETTRDNAARFARPDRRKVVILAAIAAVVAVALLNRMYFLIYRGGLAPDQVAWAMQNYFGGITKAYLQISDAFLSWKIEAKPWSYLPGYPLFLAILNLAGVKDLAFMRFAQIIIDSLIILPLYFVLFRLGKSAYLAIFGCLIYAAAPWWSAGSTYLLAESLLPAFVILLLAAMLLVRERAERSANWFLLGLFAAILPFFRSEMVLLFGPLAIWALLVAPRGKRISSAIWVMAGFAFPLLLWTVRNYYIHGQFMLAPPAKWYAAWAGLGQVSNDYGYFVSDARAVKLLASKGIQYHSLEAEKYWFGEYLGAWVNHPEHVISAILYRFHQILGRVDTDNTYVSRGALTLYGAMAFIVPAMLIWLLRKGRAADAFFVAWPMLYALGSLGILYVERRYVRYAGLTYLLALPIVLGAGGSMLRAAWPQRWRLVEPGRALSIVAAIGLLLLATGAALQLALMRSVAQTQGLTDRLEISAAFQPTLTLETIAFRSVDPTVKASQTERDLALSATAPVGSYLLMTPTGGRKGDGVIVRYRVASRHGTIGFGVLSADGARWLSHHAVSGEAAEEIEGVFASAVEAGSQFVIDAQGTKPVVDVVVGKLDLTLVCPEPANPFRLFFTNRMVEPRACP